MGKRETVRKLYILADAFKGRTAAFRMGSPGSLRIIYRQRTVHNKSVELLSGMARKACVGDRGNDYMKNKVIRGIITLFSVILTARAGRITFNGHTETWYDKPMNRVIGRVQMIGIPADYWIRDDGVKMFGPWVIVAAHQSKIRYTRLQTSLGEGIILDYHTMDDPELYDIATDWKVEK